MVSLYIYQNDSNVKDRTYQNMLNDGKYNGNLIGTIVSEHFKQ